jgi:ankyrin repeat protein
MLEVFCNRFPLVTKNLLDLLDDTTWLSCKGANRDLNNFIKNEKIIWLRIIRLYKGNTIGFEDSWKQTIEKDSVNNIKQLALATQIFFKHEPRFLNQWHPLFICAAEGSLELCKHVIKKTWENNPSIVHHFHLRTGFLRITTGYTALHFVAEFGYLDVASLIIKQIENKSPSDSHENTPLFYAATQDDIIIFKLFMNNADDKMPENLYEWTPSHQAAFKGNSKVLKLILENLVEKNPPATKGRNIGVTPLHLAAQEGHVNVCKLIMKYVSDQILENGME